MKKILLLVLITIGSFSLLKSQYISEVIEYTPAPGQYINSEPWGMPSSATSIIGGINGNLNLGAFGGYVIFKFANSVENHPDNPYGIDFSIFANPMQDWSEPAVVYVMKDENNNGQPDDNWYELAGSDYFFSSSIHNYEVIYSNPGGNTATDVPWEDNCGNSGFIYANSYHTQPYYPSSDLFPHINNNNYQLTGSYITGNIDKSNSVNIKSYKRSFGYADNQIRGYAPYTIPDNPYTKEIENSGGDAFDINWAIDQNGNYVNLDEIDFIKVQNAMLKDAGYLGEISTEISGAIDIPPDNSFSGQNKIIVIKDLPKVITTNTYQLEVFVFEDGRLQNNKNIIWQTSMPEADINENNILTVTKSGELDITAILEENTEIKTSVHTIIDLESKINSFFIENIKIYPNPAKNYFLIKNIDNISVKVVDINGKILISKEKYYKNQKIDVSSLSRGIYFIEIRNNFNKKIEKIIIQ